VKNALTLGSSLVATWAVALVVRFFLPRHLGPEQFGVFNFADAFAATFFVVLGLGLETYIRKEIPVRPEHASDFFGGFLAARVLMSLGVFAAMALVLTLAHRPPSVQRIVFVFGAAQFLVVLNGNLAALLHASRAVGGLALVNVASKVLWGAGVAVAIVLHAGLVGLALAFLGSEALRSAALLRLVRRQIGLQLRLDWKAIRAVTVACFPFYVIQVANTVYAGIAVTLLSLLASDVEVGWYGTSSNLAGLAFLLSPLVSWVLMPLLARAASRSKEELYATLRRAILTIVPIVMPISLLMGAGADLWVPGLFGGSYEPATLSLRLLAPVFIVTYLAMMTATCLLLVDRAWTVTFVSIAGLIVNPVLVLAFVPRAIASFGDGGAGAGAAAALLLTELLVTAALMTSLGKVVFDRPTLSSLGKAALGYVAMIALDRALAPLGPVRLLFVTLTYVAFLLAVGSVKVAEIRTMARFVMLQRQAHAHT
jgi:O-antigen/teichoic acid export membrane protein